MCVRLHRIKSNMAEKMFASTLSRTSINFYQLTSDTLTNLILTVQQILYGPLHSLCVPPCFSSLNSFLATCINFWIFHVPLRESSPTATYVPFLSYSPLSPFSILHSPSIICLRSSLTHSFCTLCLFTIMKNDFTITTFLHLQHKQNPISILNYQYLTSIKTLTPHITCLAVHRNLLYAASLNLINVFDLSSSHYTLIDTFNETTTSGYY